jgi:RNA polymerase sigma factor (sigma-70 family)
MNDVIGHLRRVALRGDGGPTDSQLLECFLARRDEAAFAALVRRHGPMVLAVCRRVLGNHHDAEDAFQATFLVLARKGAALRARELVGNWLHGVAYRTALRAKAMTARRQAHERQARELARPRAPADDGWQELLPLLDQELDRLPERYRVAVVLCDLEGVTRREAARQLGVPEGTLSGRLTRARRLLARRLARYGLAPSGGALAAVLSERTASAGVTSALAATTTEAAVLGVGGWALTAGAVPARVVALAEGVVKTMLLTRLKAFVAVAFVLLVGAGAVGLTYRTGAAEPEQARAGDAQRTLADELEALRLEVQALRKSVEANRERVKALEGEVASLRGRSAPGAAGLKEELERAMRLRKLAEEKALKDLAVSPRGAAEAAAALGKLVDEKALKDLATRMQKEANQAADPLAEAEAPSAAAEAATALGKLVNEKALKDLATRMQKEANQAADPLAEAEAALKKLRGQPDDKQATDALERALKRLKERAKPDGAAGSQQKQ